MFSIEFIQTLSYGYQTNNIETGEIVIGEFREFFHSSLSYWNKEQYLKQWKEGIWKICIGKKRSSLITDMYDPCSSNIIQWWVLHSGDTESVHIRNELLFLGDLKQSFEEDIYNYIEERPAINKNGKEISEWEVNLSDLRDFYSKVSDYES